VSETEKGNPTIPTCACRTASSAPRTLATMARSFVTPTSAPSNRSSTSAVSRIWGMALGDTKLPKSSRSNPTASSRLIYAALVAVGMKRCMPCIASRGHSVIDTIALIDFHGKRKPGLDTPQLQRRFRLLVIAVLFAQFALAEPRADPVGRASQQGFERAFDGWIAHYPVGIHACFICSGGNRIVYAA